MQRYGRLIFKKTIGFLLKCSTSYDQVRSTLHNMDMEVARKELFLGAGKSLLNVTLEEYEKVRVMSSLQQLLGNMKKMIKELYKKAQALEVLLGSVKDEVKEVNIATSLEVNLATTL